MKIVAILFGLALLALGVFNFTPGGGVFLLLLGVLAVILALLQGRWPHNNPLYGTLMMAILALLSSLRGVFNLFRLLGLSGGELTLSSQLVYVQSITAGLSLLYIILCISLIPNFWQGWKAFGHFLGDWLARVALTIFYFTILIPFGLGVRLLADPLAIKNKATPFWRPRTTGDQKLEQVLRQF